MRENKISNRQVVVSDYNNKKREIRTESWTELKWNFYDEEFDPGSGWTLATGLTHASRGVAG